MPHLSRVLSLLGCIMPQDRPPECGDHHRGIHHDVGVAVIFASVRTLKTFYLGSSQFRNTRSLQKTMLMKFSLHQSWLHGVLPHRRPKLLGKERLLRQVNTLRVLEVELYNNMLCDGRNTSGPRLVVEGKHARQHFRTWIQLTWEQELIQLRTMCPLPQSCNTM